MLTVPDSPGGRALPSFPPQTKPFTEQRILDSHLHPLHLDPPGRRGLVQDGLHGDGDALPVGEDLVQVLGAEDVPQRGLGQQPAVKLFSTGDNAVIDGGWKDRSL